MYCSPHTLNAHNFKPCICPPTHKFDPQRVLVQHFYTLILSTYFSPHILNTHNSTLIFVLIHIYFTGWRGAIGCLIFLGHFLQKSPIISGSFAKNDLQLRAFYESSPPCTLQELCGIFYKDALSCRSFVAKEPLIIGLFCGNDR